MLDFGAQSHGVWSRCLRFAGEVTRPPRKTRFRLLARLCRTGLVTRRVSMKGFTLEAIPLSRTSWRNVSPGLVKGSQSGSRLVELFGDLQQIPRRPREPIES